MSEQKFEQYRIVGTVTGDAYSLISIPEETDDLKVAYMLNATMGVIAIEHSGFIPEVEKLKVEVGLGEPEQTVFAESGRDMGKFWKKVMAFWRSNDPEGTYVYIDGNDKK